MTETVKRYFDHLSFMPGCVDGAVETMTRRLERDHSSHTARALALEAVVAQALMQLKTHTRSGAARKFVKAFLGPNKDSFW
jgi:hypothetical protein